MFDSALYYPTIDIANDYWLKSVVLFWNRIETIVPEELEYPYKNRTTKLLEEAGILHPHRVNPFCVEVSGLYDDLESFCNTRAGRMSFVKSREHNNHRFVVWDGLTECRGLDKYGGFYIHASKLPYDARERFGAIFDGYVKVSEQFMKYYMTLLANRICQQNDMALLTDKVYMNNLSNETLVKGLKRSYGENDEELRLGLMYKVVLEGINLNPATPIERIIDFKRNRGDELERFRREMSQLTDFESIGMSPVDIENEVRGIYINRVMPAVIDLKRTLKDARLDWINASTGYIMTGIIPSALTLQTPQSILPSVAGGFVGMTLASIQYKRRLDREEKKSPYTYLLKMRNHFMNRQNDRSL